MMKLLPALRAACCALVAAAALAGCSSAPEVATVPALAPTSTVEQANARLAAVEKERKDIEARYAERERVCYDKFFVNRCLDEARERRRSSLAAQRAIEIEASRFLRRDKVAERDRAMAESEAKYQAEEAALASPPPAPKREATNIPPPKPSNAAGRIARRDARLKQAEAKEKAEAAERAANVEAFNKRKAESEERQRKVAERKAEKAAKDAKDQQAPPANTGQPPAPAGK
jgi:hypothetical protein